jgi:2-polyprenyl-3-methyl-5-hydroxy-6-metoxy-1,4-benzoquinol methylase
MFKQFPKVRTQLPLEFEKIYKDHYKKNRDGDTTATSVAQRMERWMHKKVAEDLKGSSNLTTLEIGAGTLNQLEYENTSPYDIIEPFHELYKESSHLKNIRNIYNDISEINGEKLYDRVTSIATFEHVLDLPQVVAKSALLLKDNGCLRVAIPNEGTILWTLGWKLTTGVEFKLRYGLDYSIYMKYEHVNNAAEIEEVLNYFFNEVKHSVFGISKGLAFYRFYECKQPDLEHAKKFV